MHADDHLVSCIIGTSSKRESQGLAIIVMCGEVVRRGRMENEGSAGGRVGGRGHRR